MPRIDFPNDYKLLRFEKSRQKYKKYDAILQQKKSKKEIRISFGDNRYEHYKDSTGLGLYSDKDHLNQQRRRNFRKRHANNAEYKFSSAYFAMKYLW